MAVYLDSSALVKLVVAEPESGALRTYLRSHTPRITCGLARTEIRRAVRARGADGLERAERVLSSLEVLALDDDLLDHAGTIGPPLLRSLDAIHVVAALRLGGECKALVTYDARMADAAGANGLRVVAPS